jgi:hypothetical protein
MENTIGACLRVENTIEECIAHLKQINGTMRGITVGKKEGFM